MAAVYEPTGHARRTLDVWPLVDQITALLEELAAKTDAPEEKEALSKTAKVVRGLGSFSGQFIIGVASGLTGSAIAGGG
jgi:hypothetical protein